jgi:hypothetical protein
MKSLTQSSDRKQKGENMKITARIEMRTWYVKGKYVGDKAEWVTVEPTANIYVMLLPTAEREIENRRLMIENANGGMGERHCHPCELGDWGQYRIVTIAE